MFTMNFIINKYILLIYMFSYNWLNVIYFKKVKSPLKYFFFKYIILNLNMLSLNISFWTHLYHKRYKLKLNKISKFKVIYSAPICFLSTLFNLNILLSALNYVVNRILIQLAILETQPKKKKKWKFLKRAERGLIGPRP